MLWFALFLRQSGSPLEGLACWAGRYTPKVALANGGLLLEVSGSLKLFGGAKRLARRLRADLRETGSEASLAAAPTAQGAWLLARSGREAWCGMPESLFQEMQFLSIETLETDPETLEALRSFGVRTLGEALALPRAGLARRCGQALLDQLDRALGRAPEAHRFFIPPPRFASALELPAETDDAPALVFAARRLLAQLCGYLEARSGAVARFRLELRHRAGATGVEIGLARPGRELERLAALARERLGALALPAPVRALALEADEILALAPRTQNLLADGNKPCGDWRELAERLAARLGEGAVRGLAAHADHRPEKAWSFVAAGESLASGSFAIRPLWLLERPRRLAEGSFALLAGPERIESGWWDGAEVARDYFIARQGEASLAWIYRSAGGWFLHGVFA